MRTPCELDDLYNPLRDAWNGRPICSHCSHSFVDFYRLRNHINRRVCISFNPAQELIIPIVARPNLKMHLRHKSIPGLLLNQALIKELFCHCAFCHCQIAARSIHKHYTDQHPLMVSISTKHIFWGWPTLAVAVAVVASVTRNAVISEIMSVGFCSSWLPCWDIPSNQSIFLSCPS